MVMKNWECVHWYVMLEINHLFHLCRAIRCAPAVHYTFDEWMGNEHLLEQQSTQRQATAQGYSLTLDRGRDANKT